MFTIRFNLTNIRSHDYQLIQKDKRLVGVGDKIMTNYVFALTGVPIDFPIALELE